MKAIELYTKLIEKSDRTMNSSVSDVIKAVAPVTRAQVGGYFLNESLNNNVAITPTLCRISVRLFPSIKLENDQVKAGWSVIRPLYINNLIALERESKQSSRDANSSRNDLFKNFKNSKQNSKKRGDWTSTMFREPGNKDSREFLFKLFTEFDVSIAQMDRNKIYNKKPKNWTGYYHNDEEAGVSFGKIITNANTLVKQHFQGRRIQPVLDAVNKLQGTTFYINEDVLERLKRDSVSD